MSDRKVFVSRPGLGFHRDYLLRRPFRIPDPKDDGAFMPCECGHFYFVFGSTPGEGYCMKCHGRTVAYGREKDRVKLELAGLRLRAVYGPRSTTMGMIRWNDYEMRYWGWFESVILLYDEWPVDGICLNLYWFRVELAKWW